MQVRQINLSKSGGIAFEIIYYIHDPDIGNNTW